MTDRDIGDMFLNFQLHASVVPFTGVDLVSIYNDLDEVGPRWAVWDRNLMGFMLRRHRFYDAKHMTLYC